jgi:hypothetical protein
LTPPYQQQLHAWHTTRPWLAVVDAALGAVCVYEVEPAAGSSSSGSSNGKQGLGTLSTPRATLLHELHRQVRELHVTCKLRPVMCVCVHVGVLQANIVLHAIERFVLE